MVRFSSDKRGPNLRFISIHRVWGSDLALHGDTGMRGWDRRVPAVQVSDGKSGARPSGSAPPASRPWHPRWRGKAARYFQQVPFCKVCSLVFWSRRLLCVQRVLWSIDLRHTLCPLGSVQFTLYMQAGELCNKKTRWVYFPPTPSIFWKVVSNIVFPLRNIDHLMFWEIKLISSRRGQD